MMVAVIIAWHHSMQLDNDPFHNEPAIDAHFVLTMMLLLDTNCVRLLMSFV
jgi:hypothetical protein